MKPSPEQIVNDVRLALQEDIGSGDVTALLLPESLEVEAKIFTREPMLLCGIPWVNEVFSQVDSSVRLHWQRQEGDWLDGSQTLCKIEGKGRSILTAERTALNFLQTLSGTATQTYRYVQTLKETGSCLLDTRKTLPGLRMAQKYAVASAGGHNHRMGLYDAFLIKENHIKACGSITLAINRARGINKALFLEVEVESLEELKEALDGRPDRIMLDNFSINMLQEAVALNQPKRCDLEASGGYTLDTIQKAAATGVDFISVGSITKSVKAIDLSLLVIEAK